LTLLKEVPMSSVLRHNSEKNRYEMPVDEEVVFAEYRREGSIVHLLHVEAPPSLRGTGAAGKFMQALMETLRAEKLKVVPLCSYAAMWIARHTEFQDLLEAGNTTGKD